MRKTRESHRDGTGFHLISQGSLSSWGPRFFASRRIFGFASTGNGRSARRPDGGSAGPLAVFRIASAQAGKSWPHLSL